MKLLRTKKEHANYWKSRKIDWKKHYLDTWNHPHREAISRVLSRLDWVSLFELGCGPGANLVNISKHFKNKQLGGIDINEDAIALARKTFGGGLFKVGDIEDIMLSDKAVDVVLSDMTLIYIGNINKVLKEIKRIGRSYVVFCELHSDNLCGIIRLKLKSGYFAHNYKKLLEKHGFNDIEMIKIPEKVWDSEHQISNGYIIIAKIPKK